MHVDKPLLPDIRSPKDLKNLGSVELARLAAEIRDLIVTTVSKNGGHLSSNLGVVELTIALHLVFNSPEDKIVFDVGHQCYTHKILTGRYENFHTLRQSSGIAGFPKSSESVHDSFNTGHASTSISAALGMLAAEKLLKSGKRAAAVIGDGALTGGQAFEALAHAGHLNLPLVVILNDNKMSIGPNVGGLSKYLSRLSMKAKYQSFRRAVDKFVQKIPFLGVILFKIMLRFKRAVKAIFYTDNFFVDLGFEYVGPIDGHNIPQLVQVITDAKNLYKPVVIHVNTRKGKGYGFAEDDPGGYHGVKAFKTAIPLNGNGISPSLAESNSEKTFTQVFGNVVLELGRNHEDLVAITAAMEEGTGLSAFKAAFPKRFFDVGIAEEHAVTFAAGLAKGGLRPIAAIYSTFIQRGMDQIIHDVSLQNLPVIFALDRAGLVNDDGETHQGIYDISLFRSSPDMTILAPAGEEELKGMFEWALKDPSCGPVVIRYPKTACPPHNDAFSVPMEKGRGVFIRKGNEGGSAGICIAFTGGLYQEVIKARNMLVEKGIETDLYNFRFLKPVDEDYLSGILNRYKTVIIAEEGIRSGGFGEYVSELSLRKKCTCIIKILAVKEKFYALGKRDELLFRNGLDAEGIIAAVES